MPLKIYFAAPLFCDMELKRNEEECAKLEEAGYDVYLPQRDAGEAAAGAPRKQLFNNDVTAVSTSDIVIAYLDGRVPDEGTAFEMGLAFAYRKTLIAVITDRRCFMDTHLNVMLEYSPIKFFYNTEDAIKWLTTQR